MQKWKDKKRDMACLVLLYAAPLASSGIYGIIKKADVIDILSDCVIALILATVFLTCLRVNERNFYQKINMPLLYFGSLFLSFVFLGVRSGFPVGILWMSAVVVAALESGMEVAVATHLFTMIQYVLVLFPQDKGFYAFSAYILMGLVLAMLFSQLKGVEAVPYLTMILLACDGVLQCVVYHLDLHEMRSQIVTILMEFVSILFFVGCGYLHLRILGKRQKALEEAGGESQASETGETAQDISGLDRELGEVGSGEQAESREAFLKKITEPDFELLKRMEAYSDTLYAHCMRIGDLSWKAAQAIGKDALLARAGGLYHEIGRIEEEEDYIEAGNRVGKEYGFPENLLDVMRQHSTGFELPKSAEAAVVMLCDCIISTSEYLAKSGKSTKISEKQLVTSIFQNRLEKGNLQYAGMTVDQIQTLKEFYIENTFADSGKQGGQA